MYSRSRFINGPSSLAFLIPSKKTSEGKLFVEIERRCSFSDENPGVSYFRQNDVLSLNLKTRELQSQVFSLLIRKQLRMIDVIHSNDNWTDFDKERGEKLIFMPSEEFPVHTDLG